MTMFSLDMLDKVLNAVSIQSVHFYMYRSILLDLYGGRWLLSISHQLGAKASSKELIKVLEHQMQHTLYYYALSALASEASS
jgi:hypothetical protein